MQHPEASLRPFASCVAHSCAAKSSQVKSRASRSISRGVPVKRHRGEPGHTRDTQDTRAHAGTRITRTNLTTNHPNPTTHPHDGKKTRGEPGVHTGENGHTVPRIHVCLPLSLPRSHDPPHTFIQGFSPVSLLTGTGTVVCEQKPFARRSRRPYSLSTSFKTSLQAY